MRALRLHKDAVGGRDGRYPLQASIGRILPLQSSRQGTAQRASTARVSPRSSTRWTRSRIPGIGPPLPSPVNRPTLSPPSPRVRRHGRDRRFRCRHSTSGPGLLMRSRYGNGIKRRCNDKFALTNRRGTAPTTAPTARCQMRIIGILKGRSDRRKTSQPALDTAPAMSRPGPALPRHGIPSRPTCRSRLGRPLVTPLPRCDACVRRSRAPEHPTAPHAARLRRLGGPR
jgi:hypothetical protein